MSNTYWNCKGKYQELSDKLEELVPTSGSVENPRINKALEKFRKASNCYHDLYNNGLCNRANEFRTVFGIASSIFTLPGYGNFSDALYAKTESVMDEITLKAAVEQKLTKAIA